MGGADGSLSGDAASRAGRLLDEKIKRGSMATACPLTTGAPPLHRHRPTALDLIDHTDISRANARLRAAGSRPEQPHGSEVARLRLHRAVCAVRLDGSVSCSSEEDER